MWKNGGLFNMALIILLLSHRGIEMNTEKKNGDNKSTVW